MSKTAVLHLLTDAATARVGGGGRGAVVLLRCLHTRPHTYEEVPAHCRREATGVFYSQASFRFRGPGLRSYPGRRCYKTRVHLHLCWAYTTKSQPLWGASSQTRVPATQGLLGQPVRFPLLF